MKVPFYDHARIYRRREAEIDAAIKRVLTSGRLDWGEEVPAFEAEFAAHVGAAHAVTVNSGTAALKVALMGLGVGPGDEVVTVPNSDIGTTSAIHHVGAASVFVDIDPVSYCMDVAAMQAAITPRTRAILAVDLYGHPADMPASLAIARKAGVFVVEDACLALGAEIGGRRVGAFADVTCFSFAPTKHLGSIGSGGACVTADSALAARMARLSAYGQARSRHLTLSGVGQHLHHETEGLNERMDELQAAVLRVKLADVAADLATRRAQAMIYTRELSGSGVVVPGVLPGASHAWRNYVVQVDRRDAVRDGLNRRGVASAVAYTPPMHLQPVYAGFGLTRGAFPVTESVADRLLGLPIGPHLDSAQIVAAAAALRESITEAGG